MNSTKEPPRNSFNFEVRQRDVSSSNSKCTVEGFEKDFLRRMEVVSFERAAIQIGDACAGVGASVGDEVRFSSGSGIRRRLGGLGRRW